MTTRTQHATQSATSTAGSTCPPHLISASQPTVPVPAGVTVRLDAGGTIWRLRSLVAMGHGASRIARAMRLRPAVVRELIRGEAKTVTPELRDLACQLWDAWWDKRPPERTQAERRAASGARHRAERHGWCTPLGLDEDELDEPGYRPYSLYRFATGTGIAADFRRAASWAIRKEIA